MSLTSSSRGANIEIDASLSAARVVGFRKRLAEIRRAPQFSYPDNGPMFIVQALQQWAQSRGIDLNGIQPGAGAGLD